MEGVDVAKVERCALHGMTIGEIVRSCGSQSPTIKRILREHLPPEIDKERKRLRAKINIQRKRNIGKGIDLRLLAECALQGMPINQISLRCGFPRDEILRIINDVFPPFVEVERRKALAARHRETYREWIESPEARWHVADVALGQRDDVTEDEVLDLLRECRLVVRTAETLNLPVEIVELIAERHSVHVIRESGTKQGGARSDEQLLEGVRQAWEEECSEDRFLSVNQYNIWARRQEVRFPTSQIVQRRFGSWKMACRLAGIPVFEGHIGKPKSMWSAERCQEVFDAWIRERMARDGKYTVASYIRWSEKNDAPSHTTLRKYLVRDSWYELVAEAIARVKGSAG